jgi:hypothetical protein
VTFSFEILHDALQEVMKVNDFQKNFVMKRNLLKKNLKRLKVFIRKASKTKSINKSNRGVLPHIFAPTFQNHCGTKLILMKIILMSQLAGETSHEIHLVWPTDCYSDTDWLLSAADDERKKIR